MAHTLSLAHLTVVEAPPPAVVRAAAAAGFPLVGLRLLPARAGEAPWPMRCGSPMFRETLASVRGEGVGVHDIEIVRLRRAFAVGDVLHALDAAAELQARRVMVNVDDDDMGRAADHLAVLAKAGSARKLRIGVEFMAYTALASLQGACDLVRAADAGDVDVVVDTLHLFRSGAGAGDLQGRPEVARSFAQVNDAPRRRAVAIALAEEARAHRLLPGEGDLDVAGVLRFLDPGAVLSVEAPCRLRQDTLDVRERAQLAFRRTTQWLDALSVAQEGAIA